MLKKIVDGCCSKDEKKRNALQPVKYSRRQRFLFNESNTTAQCQVPWPFEASCHNHNLTNGTGRRKQTCLTLTEAPNNNGNPCCSGGRKYTNCPDDIMGCSNMLPHESGVYYFDKLRKAFVPKKDLPLRKAPKILEKKVTVPDDEECELLANKNGDCEPCAIQPIFQPIILPALCTGAYPPPSPCYPSQPLCYAQPTSCYSPQPPCHHPVSKCSPCNPCKSSPYNPCHSSPCKSSCNPCHSHSPCDSVCNPCKSSWRPCNPNLCNPTCPSPCMPSCNPYMNTFMYGGVLPMVIPMPSQQATGPVTLPPPPLPFPLCFSKKKNRKLRCSKYNSSSSHKSTKETSYPDYPSTSRDSRIEPDAPENLLLELGDGVAKNPKKKIPDGTFVTTIDFPPGEAEDVAVTSIKRKNPRTANINVLAEIDEGKGVPLPGARLAPNNEYTKNGVNVKSYRLPKGKDGFVKATKT